MKPLFSKMIICSKCNRKHKAKMQSDGKKRIYVCSTRENYNKSCERRMIKEEQILFMLDQKYRRRLTQEEIKEEIEMVQANEDGFVIYYMDGTTGKCENSIIEF